MDLYNNKPKHIGDRVYWYDDEWHTSIVEGYDALYENGQEVSALRMQNKMVIPAEICATKNDMRDVLNKQLHKQKKALTDAEWRIVEAERGFKYESEKLDKLKEDISKFDFFAGGRTNI